MGTPISEAYERYKKMRSRRSRLSNEERGWYYTYRMYRNYTKEWNSSRKTELINQIESDLMRQKVRLAEWKEFAAWAESRVASNSKNQGLWEKHFLSKIRADVAFLENAVEDYSDDESVMDTLQDLIAAAANELQLTLDDEMNEFDDGCLWFRDEENDRSYFWALGLWNEYKVTESFAVSPRAKENDAWRERESLGLSQYAIDKVRQSNVCSNSHHPARVLNDYFGLFNGLGIVKGETTASVDSALSKLSKVNLASEVVADVDEVVNLEVDSWQVDGRYRYAQGELNSKLSRQGDRPTVVLATQWNTLWVFSQENLNGATVQVNGMQFGKELMLDTRSKWRGHGKHNLKLTDEEVRKIQEVN